MAGIHVFLVQPAGEVKTWMAGTSPAMTIGNLLIRYPRQRFLDEACGLAVNVKPLPTVAVRSMVCHKIDQPKFTQS